VSSRAIVSRPTVLALLVSLCATLALLALANASAFASPPAYLGSFGSLSYPTGVAVEESTGNVLVTESGGHEVVDVFGERGGPPANWLYPDAPVHAVTGEQTPAKEFAFDGGWSGVAVDNSKRATTGTIYVADPHNKALGEKHEVVDRFNLLRGEIEYEEPQLTGGATHFADPDGVATDADGDLYVSDTGNEMVREYSPTGAEIAKFKVEGLERSVAVDSRGDIILWGNPNGALAQPGVAEIKRSSDTATTIESVAQFAAVEGARAGAIDRATNTVYVVSRGDEVIEYSLTTGTPVRSEEFYAATLGEIDGIAVNEKTGKIYLAVPNEDKGQILVYQGTPPNFPLTVLITGEGEVTSTPTGIACSTTECTHEFEGEVTLTAAKPGAGYEFAGWIGCARASGADCTVSAASKVTAVFLKAGKEGTFGIEGKAGATGPVGLAGAQGPVGPAGAQGPPGTSGKIELVTCEKIKGKQRCTTKLVSGTVRFTTTRLASHATLSRHGVVYASGTALAAGRHMSLRLLPKRELLPGKYTLTLISGTGKHKRITSESFTLS
jgi:DNA-binding beta-propeller fold protein YncE